MEFFVRLFCKINVRRFFEQPAYLCRVSVIFCCAFQACLPKRQRIALAVVCLFFLPHN